MTDLEKVLHGGTVDDGTPVMAMSVHQAREFSPSLADKVKDELNLIAVQLDFANQNLGETQMLVTALDFSTQNRYGAVIDNITNINDLNNINIQKLIVVGLAHSREETLKMKQAEANTIDVTAEVVSGSRPVNPETVDRVIKELEEFIEFLDEEVDTNE